MAGGAVTYLRHLLPAMEPYVERDEIVAMGDAFTRACISPPSFVRWHEMPPLHRGLARRMLKENIDLPRRLRALSVDVLFHPCNFRVPRAGVPQVILIHNIAPFMPDLIREESVYQRGRLQILRELTKASLPRVSRAIFISHWGRRLVLGDSAVDEERMPIIPFGSEHGSATVESQACHQWSLKRDEYVLTVSHLYRYKKIEKLIDAWIGLGDCVSAWPLLVVGASYDRAYSCRLKQQAKSAKSRVIFAGALDAATVSSLMKDCRAFVFTSEAENLPITLLEAMAAGCPIITNRHCSMPETCGDAALYVDPASTARYQHELGRLLWDQRLSSDLRNRALRRATQFNWNDTARKTVDLLRRACTESGNVRGSIVYGLDDRESTGVD